MKDIEATIAQYGVPNEDGAMLSEADALRLFDQLRAQETTPLDDVGYYISNVRIEGDRVSGRIVATFKFE